MKRGTLAAAAMSLALAAVAAPSAPSAPSAPFSQSATNSVSVRYVCEGGLCRLVGGSAAGGGSGGEAGKADASSAASAVLAAPASPDGSGGQLEVRVGQGYMDADEFLAFLRGDESGRKLPSSALLLLLSLVLAGAALNLTPCVLPLVPVNLAVIGASFSRALAYALGIALAYGSLGVLAAVGGVAFGAVQSSPVFNAAVAAVFAALGLSLCGVLPFDLSPLRPRVAAGRRRGGAAFPFAMGALSALLAGACVAPVLASAVVLAARLYAGGDAFALAIPFALGLGMALPWPFLGAGLKVLPKPGRWTRAVNAAFAAAVLALAAWHGFLAVRGWCAAADGEAGHASASREATPQTFDAALADALPRGLPVLVDCWAVWCKSCAAMERGTMRDPEVAEALKGFSVIRLRADDVEALRRLPGFAEVRGLPAFAVISRKPDAAGRQ